MGTLYSHPGYNKYDLFCQAADIKITDDKNPIAIPANLVSNDEDNEESDILPQLLPPPIPNPKGKSPVSRDSIKTNTRRHGIRVEKGKPM